MNGEIYDYTKFGAQSSQPPPSPPSAPPPSSQSPTPQAPKPGKRGRIPCAGCSAIVLGLLAAVAIATAIAVGLPALMKGNDAYRNGLARAQQDTRVREILGDPIVDGWLPTGSVNTNGPSGSVDLVVSISGPNASGKLYIEATKSLGVWDYKALGVKLDDVEDNGYIDLLQP